jgi:hypothetical protein
MVGKSKNMEGFKDKTRDRSRAFTDRPARDAPRRQLCDGWILTIFAGLPACDG